MRIIIAALLFFSAIFSAHAQGIKHPAEGKAVVYFARLTSFGFIVDFTYFDSNKVIGRFNGKNYMRYECTPGEHLFWAVSDNKDFITAELEAGKIYFVDADPHMGTFQAGVRLIPVDPTDSKKMEKIEKLVNERTSQDMLPADLEKSTKNLESTISKGLEKYREDLAKGKKFRRLEKTMFYEPHK